MMGETPDEACRQAAADLIRSLETIVALDAEARKRAEDARAQMHATQDAFRNWLAAERAEGGCRSTPEERDERMRRLVGGRSTGEALAAAREMTSASGRRLSALLDAYEALIRLGASDTARPATLRIAGLLREAQTLAGYDPAADGVPEGLPPEEVPQGLGDADPRTRRAAQMDMAARFFERTDPWADQVMARLTERQAQSDRLWQQALAEARQLASTLSR